MCRRSPMWCCCFALRSVALCSRISVRGDITLCSSAGTLCCDGSLCGVLTLYGRACCFALRGCGSMCGGTGPLCCCAGSFALRGTAAIGKL